MNRHVLVPVTEYLHSSFRPDCEYLEGQIVERNVGERDHAKVQRALITWFHQRRHEFGSHVFPEQRVQVRPNRFRVPDVCVVLGEEPPTQIFTVPPFLCIEILSKDDRMIEMEERISDYMEFGVSCVWVIDPRTRRAWIHTPEERREVRDGVLRTVLPEIATPLSELFD